jgi:hypothetical protein
LKACIARSACSQSLMETQSGLLHGGLGCDGLRGCVASLSSHPAAAFIDLAS